MNFKSMLVVSFVFNYLVVMGFLWLAGSVVTSAIKAGTANCGTEYSIERVVSGDWFCPAEDE